MVKYVFWVKKQKFDLKNNSPTYPKALFENYFLIQKYIDKLLKFFFGEFILKIYVNFKTNIKNF